MIICAFKTFNLTSKGVIDAALHPFGDYYLIQLHFSD